MNQKEIRELIELLVEKDITEFELERGDIKVHVKRGSPAAPVVQVAPIVAAAQPLPPAVTQPAPAAGGSAPEAGTQPASPATTASPGPTAEAASDAGLYIVKSPIVGTYYEAPSPGTPPFVKVGDTVKEGQVLCIIEAMKLMNEIEAEVSGVIAKMLVSNGSPVEYGMPLFGIRRQ
jgi:acetyl-CoA carboxylase biotin carboxyl carrier protein